MTAQNIQSELDGFLETWTVDTHETKKAFVRLRQHLESMPGVSFAFKGRAGVSYSLRAKHENQTDRDLFVMVDVIDDDPEARWLSVCFYGDLITVPGEKSDLVPGGFCGDEKSRRHPHCFHGKLWRKRAGHRHPG